MDTIVAIATGFRCAMGSRLEHAPTSVDRSAVLRTTRKVTNVLNACRLIMVCIAARTKIQLLRCPRTSPSSSNVDEARAEEEDVVEAAVEDAEHLIHILLKFLVTCPLYICVPNFIILLSPELHLLSAGGFKFIKIWLMLLYPRRLMMGRPALVMKVQLHLNALLGNKRT